MEKKRNLSLPYAAVQCFFWMGFAVISAFASAYLLAAGLSNGAIGVVLALGGVTAAVLQPLVAAYADRPGSLSLRVIMLILSVAEACVGAALLLGGGRSIGLCVIAYWLALTLLQVLQPLVNALSMACLDQGHTLNFGAARAVGSAGYAVVAWVLGGVAASFGAWVIPLAMLLCFALSALTCLFFPFRKERGETAVSTAEGERRGDSPIAFLGRHRRFAGMLAGLIFMYTGHVLVNNFSLQIVMSKGGGSGEMGIATAIAALVELPVMFLFGVIVKRVPCHRMMQISPWFFFLKSLFSLLVRTITGFYFVQGCQMLGWALFCVASVYYVNRIMDERDAVKGQAYATMTYSAASVIGPLIGGRLIDALGVNAMLIFGSVCGAIGALLMVAFTERTGMEKGQI